MAKGKSKSEKKGLFVRIKKYLRAVRNEVRKVTWPTKTELKNNTIVVLGITFFVAVVTGIFDIFMRQVVLTWL